MAAYGGIGLISLPVDFIIEYMDRPRKLTPKELEKLENRLLSSTMELIRTGEELKKKYAAEAKENARKSKTKDEIEKYEESVNILEHVWNAGDKDRMLSKRI